jgi:hypothetical protein
MPPVSFTFDIGPALAEILRVAVWATVFKFVILPVCSRVLAAIADSF